MTANRGASETRAAIQDKIRRMLRTAKRLNNTEARGWLAALADLAEFIAGMAQRAGYAKGGLGQNLIRPTIRRRPAVKAK